MTSEQIRAFIAIELPLELKAELTKLQNKLRSASGNSARWVEPNGIHLTLKFLGNVRRGQIDDVTKAIEEAANGTPAFSIRVNESGCFPDAHRPQVVWVGLAGDLKTLDELVKKLEAALTRLGFKPENRPFTPHLTLARVRDTATPVERQALGEAVGRLPVEIATTIEASEICLMRSELTPMGAIYTRLAGVKLGNDAKIE
jgi:2'-5' RNA ligase